MGCLLSMPKDSRKRQKSVGEIAVFVPGLRIPKPVKFAELPGDELPRTLVEYLSALRTRIVIMAGQEESSSSVKPGRIATHKGGITVADLQQALEDYLPVLLGLVKNGNQQLQHRFQFSWINQEDNAEETTMSNSWYEVLSVLHMMAMLSLSQANELLLPRNIHDGYQSKQSQECRGDSIDVLLKATGYLDLAIRHVLPQFPPELRKDLPLDLAEGALQALCLQALAQSVDIQLGRAIDNVKANVAVKRRLACEMVKYWHQAQESIADVQLAKGWGKKHKMFIQWKHYEAKAVAYYLHGLVLEEGKTESSSTIAVAALQTADEFLKLSKEACESFHMTPPVSRNSPLWETTSKYFLEKIPSDISSRVVISQDIHNHEMTVQGAPALPDFALSLKPEEYRLPPVDPSWTHSLQDYSRLKPVMLTT